MKTVSKKVKLYTYMFGKVRLVNTGSEVQYEIRDAYEHETPYKLTNFEIKALEAEHGLHLETREQVYKATCTLENFLNISRLERID